MTRFFEWKAEGFELVDVAAVYAEGRRLVDELGCANTLVGLCLPKSARLAALMDVVQQSGNAFCWIDPTAHKRLVRSRCTRLRVKLLMAQRALEWPAEWKRAGGFFVSSLPFADDLNAFGPQFTFAISTSGSTGDPKSVLVPPTAINPNVEDFVDRFELKSTSRVLWSTNLDFDPSILELLVALRVGCKLYVMPAEFAGKIWPFERAIMAARPSFLQLTPAVHSLFSEDFRSLLFGPNSPVRHLLVGGDTFPSALVREHAQSNCQMRVYNLYGVTEVSCWASCTEFNPHVDEHADASNTIRGTRLVFAADGVEIHGRECVVNGERRPSVQTGDHFVRVDEGGREKFVITSRDKINGEVVTREAEEFAVAESPHVEAARLVVFCEQRFLFVQRVTGSRDEVELPPNFKIRSVFYVDELPLTPNGKIDDRLLRKRVEEAERADGRTGTVASFLRQHEELRTAEDPIASFGFSSRDLFEFLYEISAAHTPDLAEERLEVLRVRLFDQKTPVRLLFELLDAKSEEENPPADHSNSTVLRQIPSALKLAFKWKAPLRKCVDFSPVFHQGRVFVGDMAGFFVIVEAESGRLLFEFEAGAAIIAECVICGEKAVFCTVDGRVHVVDTSDGRFVHSAVRMGESIRAAPRPLDSERLFVATFAPHLTLVDVNTRRFEAVCDLAEAPIRNAPLISADFVLACTIDGHVGGFRRSSLKIRWRRRFATSTFVPLFPLADELFGLLTLGGELHVMRTATGELLRTLQLGESCSIEPTRFGSSLLIPAGSNSIHSITMNGERWKRQRFELPALKHQSGIVSLGERHAIKCTVDGDPFAHLITFELQAGVFSVLHSMPAPSFGDPLLVDRRVFVGCRDDHLHCFELVESE